jgi:hypothetical protein
MPSNLLANGLQSAAATITTLPNNQSHTGKVPNTTENVDPVDALFDGIVAEERNIGLMIDVCSFDHPTVRRMVNGNLYDGSDGYNAAMHRRLTKLLNNGQSGEKLHWESESFAMYTCRAPCGAKNVRCITMHVPITADSRCDYGCEEKDYECAMHAKELSVVFIFDFGSEDKGHAKADVYRSERKQSGRVVLLDKIVTPDDGLAVIRAQWRAQKIDWTWFGQDDLDLNAVWLHAYRSLLSIATETRRYSHFSRIFHWLGTGSW